MIILSDYQNNSDDVALHDGFIKDPYFSFSI
jgi:hypothetical protein